MNKEMEEMMLEQDDQDSQIIKASDLSGIEKAAVLLISFGVEKASKVLKELKDSEVEKITKAISTMKNVSSDVVNTIVDEYYTLVEDNDFLLDGGQDIAKELLVQAKGRHRADEMLRKIEAENGRDGFSIVQNTEIENTVRFLRDEHPQIAAVILAHLKPNKSAEILAKLPSEFRSKVALRMARLGKISSDVVEELSTVLKDQLSHHTELKNIQKGAAAVAGILNETDMSTERDVLEGIDAVDPELAQEIKDQMFLFEDILELEDRTMQSIITKLNKQDMVTGLKGIDGEMKEKFFNNMSSRAKEILQEDLEASGPVHVKQVEEARQNILQTIKEMDRDGKISIRSRDKEMFIE
ncbi:MAG: flagellar motor switch protein FliG [Balneolaceae bacterium]